MSKTPEKMRAEAREYRDLLRHMDGAKMRVAIEQVAVALEQSANAIEADEAV
jgi:hypothetical protein